MPTATDIAPIIEGLFNRRDMDALSALWAEDFHFEGPGVAFTGRDRMIVQDQNLWTAFPDIVSEMTVFVADDRHVAASTRMRGTHDGPLRLGAGATLPATGRPIDFTFSAHITMRDGVMVAEHIYYDTADFLRQLTG